LPPTQSTSHVENGSPAEKKIQRPVQTTQIARNGIVYAAEEHLRARRPARAAASATVRPDDDDDEAAEWVMISGVYQWKEGARRIEKKQSSVFS